MTFEEILPHLRSGSFIRRASWHANWMKNLQDHMWFEPFQYSKGFVLLRLFGNPHLTAEDLNATDWEIYTRNPTPPQERCLCGGVGCNSCEPQGRG